MGVVNNNVFEFSLWFMITIVYIISLIILYFVAKRSQKVQTNDGSKT